jgi:signal transduction histidine kinase
MSKVKHRTNTSLKGSGLGLTITNNLLQMMGSHLTLISEKILVLVHLLRFHVNALLHKLIH